MDRWRGLGRVFDGRLGWDSIAAEEVVLEVVVVPNIINGLGRTGHGGWRRRNRSRSRSRGPYRGLGWAAIVVEQVIVPKVIVKRVNVHGWSQFCRSRCRRLSGGSDR
jgi:hypothetical protein